MGPNNAVTDLLGKRVDIRFSQGNSQSVITGLVRGVSIYGGTFHLLVQVELDRDLTPAAYGPSRLITVSTIDNIEVVVGDLPS